MKDLIQFCQSVRQVEIIEAIVKHGSVRKGAKAIGLSERNAFCAVARIKKYAALRGHSPDHDMDKVVPDGFKVKGVSTYYDKEGQKAGQWVKSGIDEEKRAEIMKAALEAMCEDIPKAVKTPAPVHFHNNLCNVFTITDAHVGMLAADTDTKSGDWDLKIAEKTLVGCFAQMVESSPKAGTAVIAQLGDYLHYSSAVSAVTELHGHALDADGRMYKMVAVAIRILRRVIALALEKHEKVVLLICEGNHDLSSSVWLRAMFRALYENEPRIEVIDSELPYYVYQHGQTMLAWHHGHLAKMEQLPMIFAAQFPAIFGGSTKRYIHCGHRHHAQTKEVPGFLVEQHPTLAARDAYAARGGWIAERQVTSITYSDKYGQVARNTVTPEMIQ